MLKQLIDTPISTLVFFIAHAAKWYNGDDVGEHGRVFFHVLPLVTTPSE